jgi:DNA replication initiation complex subunit (GINS family)
MKISPMQIVEETIRKTMSKDREFNYILRDSGDDKSLINLSDIDGEIFETIEKVREELKNRASNAIDKMAMVAFDKSREWFQVNDNTKYESVTDEQSVTTSQTSPINDNQYQMIEMPDGKVVKVRMPDILK